MKTAELPCTMEGVQTRFEQLSTKLAAFDKALEILNAKKVDDKDFKDLCTRLNVKGSTLTNSLAQQ